MEKKYQLLLVSAILFILSLTACGKVRDPNSLYQEAKKTYGDCTVVSESRTDKQSVVVLHDELQDFDYEMSSTMEKIMIDGSNFGSTPYSDNTFKISLIKKVMENQKAEIDKICEENDTFYKADDQLILFSPDAASAKTAAIACAKAIQEENLNSRLDGFIIYAGGNKYEDYWNNEHYGSIVLPDITWRDPQDESVDYYTEMAHTQTDANAVFLRTEKGIFKDTGADLDRVVHVLGSDIPESPEDEVTFYYFRSSSNEEYYLCDFNYYNEDYSKMAWYTNYGK